MNRAEIADIAGVDIEAGPEPAVWDVLVRRPDKYSEGRVVSPGAPLGTVSNVSKVLQLDTRWSGRVRLNMLTERVELDGEPVQDHHEIALVVWLTDTYRLTAGEPTVHSATVHVGHATPYHPIREYLARLTWDGQERLETWLTAYMGAEDTPLIREMGKRFLMAAVARAMEPGCKVDNVLILQGCQGTLKSTALRALFGAAWYSDTPPDLRNLRDAAAQLQGLWCLEWAELDNMSRREATTIKAFISTQVDRFRPAYGRNVVERKRTAVITGSTNELEYLKDSTGERRFWPVLVGRVDVEGIRQTRDQLWAEAHAWYREDRRWWRCPEMEAALQQYTEPFRQSDTWAELLKPWINAPIRAGGFSLSDALEDGLGIDAQGQNRGVLIRAVGVLQRLGCTKVHTSTGNLWSGPE